MSWRPASRRSSRSWGRRRPPATSPACFSANTVGQDPRLRRRHRPAFDRGFRHRARADKGHQDAVGSDGAPPRGRLRRVHRRRRILVLDIMKLPGTLDAQRTGQQDRHRSQEAGSQSRPPDRVHRGARWPAEPESPLVDDEADLAASASCRSRTNPPSTKAPSPIRLIAARMPTDLAFLQVTATPYSLYLQPEAMRSAFRQLRSSSPSARPSPKLLPVHAGYVGGDDYFGSYEDNGPSLPPHRRGDTSGAGRPTRV